MASSWIVANSEVKEISLRRDAPKAIMFLRFRLSMTTRMGLNTIFSPRLQQPDSLIRDPTHSSAAPRQMPDDNLRAIGLCAPVAPSPLFAPLSWTLASFAISPSSPTSTTASRR
ncbi:hypothetical protein SBA5_800010 [Candidatus Sulfotelmatomonas gaucii]|uniref:Uncharacterized protein n=1 Tax=Candidatus Sulfuritelmatomonas gaucii TaxID=2043161 RepID=A0A2N9M620_9BACT|nr:hypothetical protein SBA5_800010 [Candidatus Sulfotelmatomonas gaucii]